MDILECGKVLNTHGIRGEIKVDNYCDPGFFKKLRTVCIGGTEYAIRSARDHGAFVLLTLEGVETIEQAMPLKNKPITVRREQVRLEKGQYLYRDLYGFSVYDQRSGQTIGTLREVLERPASMVYVIDCGGWESDTYNVVLSGSTMGFNISSGRLSVHEVMKRLGKE